MGHEDLRNQPFYQSLIQLNNDNGIVTFEDVVVAIKSYKAAVADLDEVIEALQEDGVSYSEDNDENFEMPSPEDIESGEFTDDELATDEDLDSEGDDFISSDDSDDVLLVNNDEDDEMEDEEDEEAGARKDEDDEDEEEDLSDEESEEPGIHEWKCTVDDSDTVG